MKRWIYALLPAMLMIICSCALAAGNSYGVTFHDVDAERISVEMPDGLVADVDTEDGILRVVIDDAATDWQRVLCSGGGYPYVRVRPTIQRPNDQVTGHYGFTGGVNSVTEDYIIESIEREIASYESDSLTWSNGANIGEIIADRSLFVPRSDGNPDHSPDTWGGTVICWVSQSDPDYRYYERALFCITHKSDASFHVPLRFVSADMLSPTASLSLPANIELTKLENGEVTYTVLYEDNSSENEGLSVGLRAPEGAASAHLVYEGGHAQELSISDGIAVIDGLHCQGLTRVEERQFTIVWRDANGGLLDYGLLWVHIVPPENNPWACYVENWHAVDSSRVVIENGAEGCGVDVSYSQGTGTAHIGYDHSVNISSEPGAVGVYVLPPEGAVCFRTNRSGGNVIMGRDEWRATEQDAIVQMQDYQVLDEDSRLCIRDYHPMREVEAGPVTAYVQDGEVWPYGGSVNLIYWYDSIEAAVETPDQPMRIEYICETNDVLCQVKRTPLVGSEEEITQPVEEVTAVGDSNWKLVVKRHPQKGGSAFHWDLQLENETGAYQPLQHAMVFYVPYPDGHDSRSPYTYELRHYDDAHSGFTIVDVRPTEYGLRFEVSSLSPFVLSWQEIDASGRILTLPAGLKTVGQEAFASMTMGGVILPDGIVEIGSRAFADCTLLAAVNLPSSIESIADDAFSGCNGLVAAVEEGSYAHEWCAANGVAFSLE